MKGRRKKKTGISLPLPFEEYQGLSLSPAPPSLTDSPVPSPPPSTPRIEIDSPMVREASPWSQMELWADSSHVPPSPKEQAEAALLPPPASPESLVPPRSPGSSVDPPTSARSASPAPSKNTPAKTGAKSGSKTSALEDTGMESAAEALGLDLEELRGAARSEEFRPFWSFLRSRAAARVQQLRATKSADPFEWDSPGLAAVPAFVEDRAAVELLYRSLRGEFGLDF